MTTDPETDRLTQKATEYVQGMVTTAVQYDPKQRALVVYDTEHELTRILTAAYRNVLPHAEYIDFNTKTREEIVQAFDALSPRDLVVLIQSTDFRLNAFRIRIQLFQRKLKVIDHQHLYRASPDSFETYIDALEYDAAWYRGTGWRLKKILEETRELQVICGDNTLSVTGGLEIPKPNLGDYRDMENIGGTFPIGEVFTEAKDLGAVNGSLMIYAFADTTFNMVMHDPFRIDVKDGLVVDWSENTPQSFKEVVTQIRTNERPLIREIGFGLNRAITKERPLRDITAFERNLGLHFSLGEKHTVYKKPGIVAGKTRYHVDLFPLVDTATADGVPIFQSGNYTI